MLPLPSRANRLPIRPMLKVGMRNSAGANSGWTLLRGAQPVADEAGQAKDQQQQYRRMVQRQIRQAIQGNGHGDHAHRQQRIAGKIKRRHRCRAAQAHVPQGEEAAERCRWAR